MAMDGWTACAVADGNGAAAFMCVGMATADVAAATQRPLTGPGITITLSDVTAAPVALISMSLVKG